MTAVGVPSAHLAAVEPIAESSILSCAATGRASGAGAGVKAARVARAARSSGGAPVVGERVAGSRSVPRPASFKLAFDRGRHRRRGASESASSRRWPIGYAETHIRRRSSGPRPGTARARTISTRNRLLQVRGSRKPEEPTSSALPMTPEPGRGALRGAPRATRHGCATDAGPTSLGRDFFVRIIWGGRVSLSVGIFSATLADRDRCHWWAALAGYFGGRRRHRS